MAANLRLQDVPFISSRVLNCSTTEYNTSTGTGTEGLALLECCTFHCNVHSDESPEGKTYGVRTEFVHVSIVHVWHFAVHMGVDF